MNLLLGDCLESLKALPDNSVDSVVTDPPYGLAFMGKKWDYDVPSVEIWKEVLRVLKPGGHLLSFGGTRTYHRLVVNIEEAGFEIRDQIMWIYGSGFPKSMDVSKAIDKAAGAEREIIGSKDVGPDMRGGNYENAEGRMVANITAPATPEAKQWEGWGTALKPANEPICLARKPLEGTVAKNVLKWGTGALNIDASRIAVDDNDPNHRRNGSVALKDGGKGSMFGIGGRNPANNGNTLAPNGRWPSNLLLDEVAAEVLDAQSGTSDARGGKPKLKSDKPGQIAIAAVGGDKIVRNDSGGASRFFYVAKASKRERNAGLEGMPKGEPPASARSKPAAGRSTALGLARENFHPTVKPLKLMQYLIQLVTPQGGVCLDPFMGSGSTGCAAVSLGFEFIGCELSPEYMQIAKTRIKHHKPKKKAKVSA